MAALKLNEDTTTGQLTLSTPILPRLGNIAVGLIWIVAAIIFVVPLVLSDDQGDAGMIVLFALLASFPMLTSFFGALMDTTVVIDRGIRTIAITKRLLAIPFSAQSITFGDVTNLELQHVQMKSRTLWVLNVVGQGNRRAALNWNGTQSEMNKLADKISALVGVPVASGKVQLPPTLEKVIGKLVPDAQEIIDQVQSDEPTQPSDLPTDSNTPPMSEPSSINTLPIDSTPLTAEPLSATASPTTDLNALSIQSLEQRLTADQMDSDARYVLARKYHARGQLDKALGLYQDTMRLDPINVNAQNDLGVAWHQRGKRAEAEAAYRRAIALDPFSTTAHLNLGLLLRSMNRAVESSQEFFQARQNARGDAETRLAEAASTGGRVDPQLSRR